MNIIQSLDLAKVILSGAEPEMEQFMELAFLPDRDVFALLPGANMIREFYFGNEIHLCAICNGKSGRCTEDCAFCSQSAFSRTKARVYPLLQKEELRDGGIWASETPINRYSIVTSGRSLPSEEVRVVAEALAHLDQDRIKTCASLGILNEIDLDTLKAAGVTRYHHNLETSKSYFDQICTTHTYEQRVDTIAAAKKAGLSVCSGAIFGLGETEEQILEVALALRDLDVESVPINFLIPLEGTASTDLRALTPLKCLKIISLFRYVLPRKEIIVCGGRERNLKDLHPLIFYAGASGIMTGDYLTTPGRSLERDLEMLETLCLRPRNR